MPDWLERDHRWGRGVLGGFLVLAYAALCIRPYFGWSAAPSLFDDDLLRVGSLRRTDLGEALFRPFNEHMAPLFELVSWLAWRAAGRDVLAMSRAFLVASFVAFGVEAALLVALIRRELRSNSAAMLGLAWFVLSAVSAEAVLWYSASSFTWAASATLAAWAAAALVGGPGPAAARHRRLAASMVAAATAPAFSAIGILAGPLASLRLLVLPGRSPLRRLALAAWPMAGTGLYLLICSRFHYGDLVTASLDRNLDLGAALWATARAPSLVLLPGLVGLPNQAGRMSDGIAAGLTLAGLAACLAWSARSRARPLILGGLALILGGYLAAYSTRARAGDLSIFAVQRYHLFPQIGLVWLLAAGMSPRIPAPPRPRSLRALAMATALASLLAILQYPRMRLASEEAYRYPEQPRAIEAAMRLERTCDREGITLAQAMAALEPIRPRWSPHPWPFHPLLHLFAAKPDVPRLPDSAVRPILLASMTDEDREALFGGMEATRYQQPISQWNDGQPAATARLVATRGLRGLGGGRYRVEARPGYLDFAFGPEARDARAICLPGLEARRPFEVWWAGLDGEWSPCRSVRWVPDRKDGLGVDEGVALEHLPHWRAESARRLRLIFREAGPIAVGAPRLIR